MPRAFTESESESIRASLLQAAAHAMATTGLRRTSVASLCASAGISKGTFYRFFPSKEALAIHLLRGAEGPLRARIDTVVDNRTLSSEECLTGVLSILFVGMRAHPLLRALTDREEFTWLLRGIGPEAMDAARAEDDVWFLGLLRRLQERGAVREDVDVEAFVGIPPAAVTFAQGRSLIGANRADRVEQLLVDGLVSQLLP